MLNHSEVNSPSPSPLGIDHESGVGRKTDLTKRSEWGGVSNNVSLVGLRYEIQRKIGFLFCCWYKSVWAVCWQHWSVRGHRCFPVPYPTCNFVCLLVFHTQSSLGCKAVDCSLRNAQHRRIYTPAAGKKVSKNVSAEMKPDRVLGIFFYFIYLLTRSDF